MRWIRNPLPLVLSFVLVFFLGTSYSSGAENRTEQNMYTRKSITYLKMVMRPSLDMIFREAKFLTGFDLYSFLERKIREAIEIKRFDYNPVSLSGDVDIKALAKLVKDYIDEVKVERAKAQAKMEWRFKDLVVTAEDLRKIANSAYIYWPEVEKFKVWYKIKILRGNKIEIDQEIEVEIGVRVKYYRVDFETGEPIKVADIYAEHTELVFVGRESLIPLPFPFSLLSPTVEFSETPLSAFKRCTEKVVYWLAKKINAQMRRIPDFKLAGVINSSGMLYISAPITEKEGLGIDWDFEVIERFSSEDGKIKEERVGWVRSREVADGKVEKNSKFQILSGDAGIGHIIREYPLVGVSFLVKPKYLVANEMRITEGSQQYSIEASSGKGAFGFSLGGELNLAKAFGINISELYLTADISTNFISGGSFEALGGFGLRKKFYVRSLAIIPEIPLEFGGVFVPIISQGEGTLARSIIVGISPSLSLEWFFSPRFSIFAGAGMRFMNETSEFFFSKDEKEITVREIVYNPSTSFIFAGAEITLW